MRKRSILYLLFLLIFYSCKKDGANNNNTILLQHKWTFDSLLIFYNNNYTGGYDKQGDHTGYVDFRNDHKIYTYSDVNFIGIPIPTYDTSVYILNTDNLTFISNSISRGIISIRADTSVIKTITDHNLVYVSLSRIRYGMYPRYYFHR